MKFVFGDSKARAPGARLVTGSNNEEQTKIAQSDAAIGMLSLAWINKDVAGVGIRIDGRTVEPTLENIRNGSFPIARNLNLVTAGAPTGAVKDFIDYLLGPEGQAIVQEAGYIPVNGSMPVN
jgi:phosphate transport system substrate-binding protein